MTSERRLPLPRLALTTFVAAAFLASFAAAEEVQVTVTTLAPENGVFLTPMWIGFHDGQFDVYDQGTAVSAGLERLAEDGNTAPFSNEFASAQPFGAQATIFGPEGPLFAGTTVSRTLELDPTDQMYFSFASMVVPSNDAFVANGSPFAHRVFDPSGNFIGTRFLILGAEVLDAGTEVNDEAEQSTAALGQTVPDTGTDEMGVVAPHPGFLAGGRILDARPNADFTTPGYVLAEVIVERAPRTTISFTGSGAQEVPPVTTDATTACFAALNDDEDRLRVRCAHDVENAAAAHVHLGSPGMNGPVLLPFDDAASPIEQTFDVTMDDVDAFFAGELYVNVHSAAFPGGEVRAQIDGCFAGPGGLCLVDERFQVSATFDTGDTSGVARAVPSTADAGQFTFFDPDNVELDVKVLDGCGINGHYWVFAAGLTDLAVELTVADTETDGRSRNYTNALGTPFELIRDVEAFPCDG